MRALLLLLLVFIPLFSFANKPFGGLGYHFALLQLDGQVYSWGEGENGQLGIGFYTNAVVFPTKMLAVTNATDVSAGKWITCVVDNQQVKCTGNGVYLGRDSIANVNTLVLVERIAALPIDQVFTAEDFTCVLTKSGGVRCWGVNNHGQLGIGAPSGWVFYPTAMIGFENSGVADISVGSGQHTCLLTVQGKVYCAGRDQYGQLGDDQETSRGEMQQVVGLKDTDTFRSVSCGAYHTCAIHTTNDRLYCWGFGLYGQLGKQLPTYVYDVLKPEPVAAITGAVDSVWCGQHNTFVVMKSTKTVLAFGRSQYGQLGFGTRNFTWYNPIVAFGGRSGIKSVRGGGLATCILLESGGMYCVGDGGAGRLGNGQTIESLVPVQVVGIPATLTPTIAPSRLSTLLPTSKPTLMPSNLPTLLPTRLPTLGPTMVPTRHPSLLPTGTLSDLPTVLPTASPTMPKTLSPTSAPSKPTKKPTRESTTKPTRAPTAAPTKKPSKEPTVKPTKRPTLHPTTKPSKSPSPAPTKKPSKPTTFKSSKSPSPLPTRKPTKTPTMKPSKPTTVV